METFHYRPSLPVSEWGCHFDSMLELKYAISISEEYEFLRSRIPVYYDPKTKKPTDYLRFNTRRYTPDFLIRHKQTLEAFWIEIKPRAFENEKQLITRTELAKRYIQWKGFDWKFKVVYDDEISLTKPQQELYNAYYRYKRKQLAGQTEKKQFPLFRFSSDNSKVRFIMFGKSA